ncbi:hypothetical protein ACS0TY_034693 [Phlomoides rotata]
MNFSIILSVQFKEETKLIEVSSSSSFSEIQDIILGTWEVLRVEYIKIRFSVSSIKNCLIGGDVDLRNLVLLCKHSSQNIVNVEVDCQNSVNEKSSNGSNEPHQYNGYALGDLHSVIADPCSSEFKNDRLEFSGYGEIPAYEMCPTASSKTYLSDKWMDIIKMELDGNLMVVHQNLGKS